MKFLLLLLLALSSCSCLSKKHYSFRPPSSQVVIFEDDVTLEAAATFDAKINAANEGNGPIFVVLRTGGGSANAGYLMVRTIQNSKNPVICITDTRAMSMGFYILQSCNRRIMTRNALLMMHAPYSKDPFEMLRPDVIHYFNEMLKAWCEFFAIKMKPTGQEIYDIIKAAPGGELYMNSKTGKALGAVDQVSDTLNDAFRDPYLEQF